MQRVSWIGMGAGVLAAAGLLAWAFAPRPLSVDTALASRGLFESAIEEDGRTRVRERHLLTAPLAGRLQRIALREGDAVRAGEVVARIEPSAVALLDARAQREQQARVAAAGALLAQAQARVRRAEVGVAQARNAQQRTSLLLAQGFVSPAQAEVDRLALAAAQRELEAAGEGERVARHELTQARVALDVGRGEGAVGAPPPATAPAARSHEVRAPVDGRVLRVHRDSEGAVAAGASLLEVADTTVLEAVAELLTADALRVTPGMPAEVSADDGARPVIGRVGRVEPSAFTKVSALGVEEQRVNVVVALDDASVPPSWGDGWRVTVRIVTRRAQDVLTVPVSAVFPWTGPLAPEDAPPRPAPQRMGLFVVEGGRARLRAVSMADRHAELAWIAGGLDEGARVVVYPPAELADGLRVRERARD